MTDIDKKLLDKILDLKVMKQLEDSDDINHARLHAQLPSAYVLQYSVCINHLDIIKKNLSPEESYKAAVHDFGAGGSNSEMREVYSSIILRLWVILNIIKFGDYTIPKIFENPIIDKTIESIKVQKYNYFVEPLLLNSEMLTNIIKYYDGDFDDEEIFIIYMVNYFNKKFSELSSYLGDWRIQTEYSSTYLGVYSIKSYIKNLDVNLLEGTLKLDTKIMKKLDYKYFALSIKEKSNEELKDDEKEDLKSFAKLTYNMFIILS